MKIVTVNNTKSKFDEDLNNKIIELETEKKEIIDIKFTSATGNNSVIILSALIMYK